MNVEMQLAMGNSLAQVMVDRNQWRERAEAAEATLAKVRKQVETWRNFAAGTRPLGSGKRVLAAVVSDLDRALDGGDDATG